MHPVGLWAALWFAVLADEFDQALSRPLSLHEMALSEPSVSQYKSKHSCPCILDKRVLFAEKTSWLQVSAWKEGDEKGVNQNLVAGLTEVVEMPASLALWLAASNRPSYTLIPGSLEQSVCMLMVCRGMSCRWCDECSWWERPPDLHFSYSLVYFHVWFKVCCSEAGVCPPHLVIPW